MNPKYHDLVVTHWSARFMGCNIPVAIGRSGISKKIGEGDGITPIGKYSIMGIFFATTAYLLNLQMWRCVTLR